MSTKNLFLFTERKTLSMAFLWNVKKVLKERIFLVADLRQFLHREKAKVYNFFINFQKTLLWEVSKRRDKNIRKACVKTSLILTIWLVPLARVERAAHGLGIRCSILLSYRGNLVSQNFPRFNMIWPVLSITRACTNIVGQEMIMPGMTGCHSFMV